VSTCSSPSHLLGPDSPCPFLLGTSLSQFTFRAKVPDTILTTTMIVSILFLLALAAGGDAYALARRVEQKFEDRAAFQGGWALSYPNNCPANYSTICSSSSGVNQQCCPQGTTCFDGDLSYCCPSCKCLLRLYGSPNQCQYEC
jgi:hypothetical protein